MKKTVVFAIILALLLSACGEPVPPPAPTSTPAGPNVQVDWDVLEPEPEKLAERWYDDYTDTLIPSGEYGQLVPYIGGESYSEIWGSSWFYGLATRDGVIMTDPVYLEVTALDWYEPASHGREQGDALILRTAEPVETDPADEWALGYDDFFGFAAIDGSWYTGQVYTDLVCQSELGALFFDLDGNLVMLSADGGAELWRWSADEIPFEELRPGMYYWDTVSSSGRYMIYTVWDGTTGDSYVTYVDMSDGSVLDGEPENLDQGAAYDPETNRTRFEGGWYSISGETLTLEMDSGETHSFALGDGVDEYTYPDINGDRILIRTPGGNGESYIMTDLDGNVLLRSDKYINWLWQQYGDTPSLATVSEYFSNEDGTMGYNVFTVYDRAGEVLFKSQGAVSQFGDRLVVADETSYRPTDPEGNDPIRLNRLAGQDIPAEE